MICVNLAMQADYVNFTAMMSMVNANSLTASLVRSYEFVLSMLYYMYVMLFCTLFHQAYSHQFFLF